MSSISHFFKLMGNLNNSPKILEETSNPTTTIQCRILLKTHHLEFNLKAERFLLDRCHACGEGLPHAGGPAQGELRDALQSRD